MDKISVIVPVYNVEQYLKRCVQSILNQTYSNLEIILVDDGSTDNSRKICDTFEDKRIKVFHKKNEGLGKARNTGIKKATGKYYMFVDSDDYIDSTIIENLYTKLNEKKADTCIGGFKRVYADKTEVFSNIYADQTFYGTDVVNKVLSRMFGKKSKKDDHIEMSVWKVLFSSNIIKQNNILFPSEKEFISEDIIFDIDYFSKAKVVTMSSDVGYNYCDNSDSLTTRYNSNRFELQKKLMNELVRRTKDLNIYNKVYQRILNTFISNVRYCIKLDQKYLSRKEAKQTIRKICNDKAVQNTLKNYKVDEGLKSNLINWLIYKHQVLALINVMGLKNKYNL